MAFLGGLALLGSAGEAYQKTKGKQQALDEADLDQQASVALGKGMQGLAGIDGIGGIGGPGGAPPGGPQQGAMPQQPPPVQFASGGASMPGQQPAPEGGPAAPLIGGIVGGGGGQPPAGGGRPVQTMPMGPQQGGGMPPGGGGQPMPGQPPMGPPRGGPPGGGQPPSGGGQGGMMDLPTLAGIIQSRNPGIKPDVFARALKQGASLLTPFANQQLRQMLYQNQMQRIHAAHPGYEQFEQWIADNPEDAKDPQKVGDAWNRFTGKSQLEAEKVEGRKEVEGLKQEDRMTLQAAKDETRKSLAKNKELADLEKQRRQMENNVTKNNIAMYRANIDKQHKIIATEINARAAGLSAKEAKALKDEEQKRYDDEVNSLKGLVERNKTTEGESSTFKERFGGSGGEGGGVPVPKEHAGDPDGTSYKGSDGQTYVKRGDQMVPAGR